MRTSKRVITLLVVVLGGMVSVSVAAGQDKPTASSPAPQRPPSNTRFAGCVVKITVDPAIMPLNARTIGSLLYSSAIASKASRKMLSIEAPEDTLHQLIRVELLDVSSPAPQRERQVEELMRQMGQIYRPRGGEAAEGAGVPSQEPSRAPDGTGMMRGANSPDSFGVANAVRPEMRMEHSATVQLIVNLTDSMPPLADEFLKEVVANLEESLARAYAAQQGDLRDSLNFAVRQQEMARTALKGGAEETRATAARWPMVETDAANLGGQRSELTRKMQALELDLGGIDARRKAIQEQMAVTRKEEGKRLAQDVVTQELQRVLGTSEQGLARFKESGAPGQAYVAQAEESVAKARIDLARRQEELSRQAGGGQLEEFTKELSRLVIDKAEKEAQLQIVRKQLDEVQRQLAQALTFDPEAARLRMAQEALDITGRRVAELQMRISNLQPLMVTMIGAN
jgi:hypothetical protein